MITTLLATAAALHDGLPEASFENPTHLTAKGEPIGGLIYPTPVLIDVDGDGATELVIGDLIGNLWVSERDAEGGDTAWSELAKLESSEGEPIRLSNW